MGRPGQRCGALERGEGVWEVRVTLKEGKRSKPIAMTGLPVCLVSARKPPPDCSCSSCISAFENGQKVSGRMRDGAAVETVTEESRSCAPTRSSSSWGGAAQRSVTRYRVASCARSSGRRRARAPRPAREGNGATSIPSRRSVAQAGSRLLGPSRRCGRRLPASCRWLRALT